MGAQTTRMVGIYNSTQPSTLNLSSPFLQAGSASLSATLIHTTPPTNPMAVVLLSQLLLHLPRLNSSCEDITALAYQGGWCGGARNPADYLESNKHRLSCRLRCGETSSYGEFPANCACDEQCLIHGDCCTDMSTACPMVYAAGNRKYRHLASGYDSCSKYLTYTNCDSTLDGVTINFSQNSEERSAAKELNPPFGPKRLVQYAKDFNSFLVVDRSVNVVYNSSIAFHMCDVSGSRLEYLPTITSLDCRDFSASWKPNVNSIGKLLPWCTVQDIQDVRPKQTRVCSGNPVISCLCGTVHRELIQNVCLGSANRAFVKKIRKDLYKKVLPLWLKLPTPERTGQCNVFNLSELSYRAGVDLNLPNSQNDRVIHMRVLPVVQLNTNSFDLAHPTHSIGEAH
ncbi:hypothetical protein ElyMa_006873600 [Elysia marginata]|uniref:SMB domain-containing protein n=1 Tax=Elysia marginata TaxID=1093978 RepID=A0AAV4JBP9_9GAST|nr:hypothetical protein ElyMa_006873600 [Elysia marginata]